MELEEETGVRSRRSDTIHPASGVKKVVSKNEGAMRRRPFLAPRRGHRKKTSCHLSGQVLRKPLTISASPPRMLVSTLRRSAPTSLTQGTRGCVVHPRNAFQKHQFLERWTPKSGAR